MYKPRMPLTHNLVKNLLLTREERLLLVLHYYEEMTTGEIASCLDLPERRVVQILRSILTRTRAYLDSYYREDLLLLSLLYLIPRKNREALLGDIQEDVLELRAAGVSDWKVRVIVLWQLFVAFLQWLAVWKTGIVTWLALTVRKWLLP